MLCSSPLIQVFDGFVMDAEAEELIRLARPALQRARVSAAEAGVESKGRTGSNCWIGHHQTPLISNLSVRVSELLAMPLKQAESLQVIHYSEAQEYAPHYDAWEHGTERGERCMIRGGQRLVTCLLYLNEVAGGGGTCFPRLDITVSARKGRMLVFNNCHPDSMVRHPDTLHGGMPVTRGEKWACNFWFRERDYW